MADTPDPDVAPSGRVRRQRISRWDRPPEPHDWRWAVGHLGRALITLGLMMFGFVGYQLWGTGIQTARAQDHLKSEFRDQLVQAGVTQDTLAPAETTTVPAPPPSVPETTLPDATTTTTAPAPTTAVEPVHQIYGNVKPGDSLGEIRIPKIDLDFYIVAGVGKASLNDGVGHFPNTPLPGQLGNSALAGHRTSHLAPFGDLDLLQPGDEVDVFTSIGGAYAYIVTDSLVVNPSDYHVVTDSDPTKATLTLITCTPKLSSKQRLVVHATLDTTRSSAIGAPLIYYGQGNGASFDTTDVTLPDDGSTTVDTSGIAESTTTTTGTTPAAVVTTPDTATPTSAVDPASTFADDAFSQGWFDDGAAWPHVIGWAVLFGLVWYGAYRLAKRFRNAWLGVAVGIVPFVVVLYFLYENINRLLPAAI